ncbi:hypothetical protein GF351_01085 [Candidatus Woesearchaeota archaeon]|nr:hypothetical protein [Candidatus Woesearchaeota archaeon]
MSRGKMNRKLRKIFTNTRVIILLVSLLLAVVAIHPDLDPEGITIRNVVKNSSAAQAGIESPKPQIRPMSRERIISMNNKIIDSVEDYHGFVSQLEPGRDVRITTNKDTYTLTTMPLYSKTVLNETEIMVINQTVAVNRTINGSVVQVNETEEKEITKNKTVSEVVGMQDLGLSVYEAPTTNLKKGLDLQGGTRVVLQPEKRLSQDEMDVLLENMKYRLNVYGLSDIVVREASDLSGSKFIIVEIAGATEEEVKELLARQGKFEARVGNESVFRGGNDIKHVCRTAECSGIDPTRGCGKIQDAWVCRFSFAITISTEAAQRMADATRNLEIIEKGDDDYLSEKIRLYLDDQLVDELNIASELRGKSTTDISISGSGAGPSVEAAGQDALKNMKKLQTLLITGSLPVKLEIVKTDNISPTLGDEFVSNALLVGLVAVLAVAAVVLIRYRKIQVAVPIIITSVSEVVLLLGIASLIGWNLDLAAIAGIIIVVGTGIDHLIVITDETLGGGKTSEIYDWKKRIKNAFSIIMAAFLTTFVAMLPLVWNPITGGAAGAGLLRGFALTTLFGIFMGVFIARPAYAAMIENLLKD